MPAANESTLLAQIQEIVAGTSRIEERVRGVNESVQTLTARMDRLTQEHHDLQLKFEVLVARLGDVDRAQTELREVRIRIRDLEEYSSSWKARWQVVVGYVLQGVFIVIVAWILVRLGLQHPPVP